MGSGRPLIILHGLMGMLDNWLTPAKHLAKSYEVYLVDQRNHGHSDHSDTFNYAAMAEDLYELIDDLFLTDILLLGHSMGGKTAMKFAQNYPELVSKLVVVDIAPKAYPVHHHAILAALSAVDLGAITRRSEAEKTLAEYIDEKGIRQFLLKNLYWKEKGQLAWRFNLEAIKNNIEMMGEAVYDRMYENDAYFIHGANSSYLGEEDFSSIPTTFPKAQFITIPDAGHWVHADQPKLFLEALESCLNGENPT